MKTLVIILFCSLTAKAQTIYTVQGAVVGGATYKVAYSIVQDRQEAVITSTGFVILATATTIAITGNPIAGVWTFTGGILAISYFDKKQRIKNIIKCM